MEVDAENSPPKDPDQGDEIQASKSVAINSGDSDKSQIDKLFQVFAIGCKVQR
jgi:hypothetical protein